MRDNMIRVLMCGPLATSGGVAGHTKNLMKTLSDKNVDLIFFDFYSHKLLTPSISKAFQRTVGLFFEAIKKKKEYDIIHIQSSGGISSFISSVTGCIVSKILSKRLIITFHYSKTRQFVQKYKILFGFVLKNTDYLILVSNNQRRIVTNLFPQFSEKIIVIPNGYDSNLFYNQNMNSCRNILGLPLDKKIIINISNLIEFKGHKYLIEAMTKISKNRDDVLCYIIGKGNLENEIRYLINKFELDSSVNLLGWIPDEELAIWINASDLFVFPSLAESFGMVQIEAMACGKPVISTYNGGSEDIIISNEFGLLCEPSNSEKLAELITVGLNTQWNSKKIIEYNRRFTWNNVSGQILRCYESILR